MDRKPSLLYVLPRQLANRASVVGWTANLGSPSRASGVYEEWSEENCKFHCCIVVTVL